MALLDRSSLLKKEELTVKKVALGGEDFVYVRQMTGRERDRFEQSLIREKPGAEAGGDVVYERSLEDFRAKLAVNTICTAEGDNILEPKDYPTLSQHMSAARLEVIVNAAQKLNKISEDDKTKLVKNSSGALSADSTLDSAKS